MSLPTVSDVQAVEPILQNLLVAYSQADTRFVANRVFPGVSVDKDSGTYYIFTKKYWFLNSMQVRAPGGPYPRGDFGVETDTYNTNPQYALGYPIADETRANSQIPMDLEQVAVRWLGQQNLINQEVRFSADFMKTGVWGTDDTTTTDWDDFTTGDPRSDFQTAINTVSKNTGMAPNTAVMGYIVHQALLLHPDILDVLKYTQAANIANTDAALAAVLGIERLFVARGTYSNTNENASFSATSIIDDDCLVCYVDPNPGLFSASAGYTFYWQPGGGLGTMQPVYRDQDGQSDMVRIKAQIDQKVVASDLGYFFSDVV